MQTRENIPVLRTLKIPDVLPSAPLLEAVNIQGVNITIAASSPLEGENTVMFEGAPQEGFFTRATIEGSSNGNLTPVSITLNPTNPTGQYRVVLKSPNGTILSAFPVCWDADQKKLTLGSSRELWSASGAQGKAMNQQAQEILAMSQNPTIVGGSLGQMQQSVLIGTLPTLGAPYCNWAPTFQTAFFKAHPEWRDEVMHETAMKAWENRVGNYTVTQIYTQMMRDRTDLMSSLGAAYSQYYSMLSDLLQRGLSTLSDIRNGGNDTRLRSDFSLVVSSYAGSIPMSQLSNIGIGMPNADTILRAVDAIWNKNCQQLIQTKTAEARIAAGQLYHEQLVANGFVQTLDGTMVAATDPRATTGLVFFVDSFGRQTLLPQTNVAEQPGTTYGLDITSTTLVASTNNEVISSVYESIGLKLDANGEFKGLQDLTIYPTRFGEITFTVKQDSMVNMWTGGSLTRSLSLDIKGGSLPNNGYNTLSKTGISGDSVSLKLTPGNYTLRVQDQTNYTNPAFPNYATTPFSATVGVDIGKYSSSKIEGKISIDGNSEVMPVSMSVAEFYSDTGKRKENYDATSGQDAIKKLNHNLPVWVVIHGMNSSERGSMELVARELFQSGMQVVTINWEKAALSYTTQDAPWTKPIGEWVARQLINAGFPPSQINTAVHSHATYVAYAMASEIMEMTEGKEKINAIVALDPANNVPLLSGFVVGDMNLANVSRNSIGIEGSLIAGSDSLATTAATAYKIDSNNTEPYQIVIEHSLPVTTLANLLKAGRIASDTVPKNLLLSEIMTASDMQQLVNQKDTEGSYEGTISVTTKESIDTYGRTFTEAIPIYITQTITGDTKDKIWDILCIQ